MIGISNGSYPMTAGQTKYQTANNNKKSNGNHGFGTRLVNGQYYINVVRDKDNCDFLTFGEVDKIPGKYALKDGEPLGMHWRDSGAEYRFFHAAESTEENPILVARGVDEHGKLFEEKIDLRQINPYNTNQLEIDALSYFKPGEYKTIVTPFGSKDLGLQDRFDFITDYQRDIRACRRLNLRKEAAWLQEEVDFLLSFTNGSARPNKIGSAYTVDADFLADFANENSRNLELYSSAVRERMISGMSRKCSEELSEMLWK